MNNAETPMVETAQDNVNTTPFTSDVWFSLISVAETVMDEYTGNSEGNPEAQYPL